MATEKQIAANRKNALKSSGPRSLIGKKVSSRNSTRHGFYASSVLLPDEDREVFIRFARKFVGEYAPRDAREEELVRSIIETQWQLRRANVVDTELFQIYSFYEGEQRGVGTAFAHDAAQANAFSKLMRYQGFLLKKLQSAKKELEHLRTTSALGQPADFNLTAVQTGALIPVPKVSGLSPNNEITSQSVSPI